MQLWQEDVGSGCTRVSVQNSRALAVTSGNAQQLSGDSTSHPEFAKHILGAHQAVPQSQPQSTPTSSRTDDEKAALDEPTVHKTCRSSHPPTRPMCERPYLRNPKYIDYRKRKRFDNGPDGKPVWPDEVEESFQNAVVHIPPMGKNKKTQHGRLYGRNELIAEWIKQDTGEERSRKQVSSHIQVLSNLFKGDEDWKALTVYRGQNSNTNDDLHHGSIADQVRLQRQLMAEANFSADGGQWWPDVLSRRVSVQRLPFEMWVGMPGQVSKSLHDYTRISSDRCTSQPVPLESVKNWRSRFPHLESILQSSAEDNFDIILVKSKILLMTDYPPVASKLALVLNLDFRNSDMDNSQSLNILKRWSCASQFYSHGQLLHKTGLKSCSSEHAGCVTLAGEADWWAAQFTHLIQKRKEAESSLDRSAVATAEEQSRALFRSLTIMQEVFASPVDGDYGSASRKRMAVLLWTFSQANRGHSGVASWCKVIPPTYRTSMKSPGRDSIDITLPPLGIDIVMDGSFDTRTTITNLTFQDLENHLPLSPANHDASTYHSGFTPVQPIHSEPERMIDFGLNTGLTPKSNWYAGIQYESFNFTAPLQPVPTSYPIISYTAMPQPVPSALQLPSNGDYVQQSHSTLTDANEIQHHTPTSPADRQQPLAKFDMRTHQMLQAQLGPYVNPEVDYESPTADNPAEVDSQLPMIGNIDRLGLGEDEVNQETIPDVDDSLETQIHRPQRQKAGTSQRTIFDLTQDVCQRLVTRNSFTGFLHPHSPSQTSTTETEPDALGFGTPARQQLERLVDNQYRQSSSGNLFGDHDTDHLIIDQLHFPGESFNLEALE